MQQTLLAGALAAVLVACASEPAGVRQAKKVELIGVMQRSVLQSVEAEKSAVLAITDEESTTFANESKKAAAEVEASRLELHRLVEFDARPSEAQKLSELDASWREVQAVDEKLLALAVANTNLKAARLASGECATAVNQLVDALAAVEEVATEPKRLRALSKASVSALRIQSLLAPHIASPDDAEMTRLETQMQGLGTSVELGLAEARTSAPAASKTRAAEAWEAWARYQHLTAEVVHLSRLNTNVVSYDLSVHEKRKVTVATLNALGALLADVQSVPRPTR